MLASPPRFQPLRHQSPQSRSSLLLEWEPFFSFCIVTILMQSHMTFFISYSPTFPLWPAPNQAACNVTHPFPCFWTLRQGDRELGQRYQCRGGEPRGVSDKQLESPGMAACLRLLYSVAIYTQVRFYMWGLDEKECKECCSLCTLTVRVPMWRAYRFRSRV